MSVRMVIRGGLLAVLIGCGVQDDPAGPPGNAAFLQSGVPPQWFGGSARADLYDVGTDQGIRRGGATAGYLRSKTSAVDNTSFATMGQSLSALGWRGRRIRLTGWMHAEDIEGPGAGLWMRVDTRSGYAGFDNMGNRAIRGSQDWASHSITLDVPADAIGISFGFLMQGRGIARVDDLQLEVVDASVPTTGSAVPVVVPGDSVAREAGYVRLPHAPVNLDFEGTGFNTDAAASWLASVARPFTSDAPGTALDDLAELGRVVGSARVVGFGEATHGTREFFRMKHRAFEYLVERMGFTHFTIEATMPEARAMDRYVTHGVGDPSRLLAGLYFWTWNTDEVLELVQWMRAYNVRVGAPRLRFFGFDMQFPGWAVDSIPAIIARADPGLAARSERAVGCLKAVRDQFGRYDTQRYVGLTLAVQNACSDSLAVVAEAVKTARGAWSTIASEDLDWLEQYVTLARQWERMARMPAFRGGAERDRSMAANIGWIASRAPSAKIFAWAHNGHVSRRPNAMGAALHAAMGDAYRVFAFTFGGGRFNAYGMSNSGTITTLQEHAVVAPTTASFESMLSFANMPRAIVDIRQVLTAGAAASTFDRRPVPLRSIGSVYAPSLPANYYENALFPLDYDAIIWFANTTASRLRPF
ncbi:MAG: erythromycin esterase family protein [Cytophagaceae bacterium]|nr:erythromycin esterase family protein [Gemmatimonadaceae bacterium]